MGRRKERRKEGKEGGKESGGRKERRKEGRKFNMFCSLAENRNMFKKFTRIYPEYFNFKDWHMTPFSFFLFHTSSNFSAFHRTVAWLLYTFSPNFL
jgi:hypothetical protein